MFQRDLTRQEVAAVHDVMRSPGWELLQEAISDEMASHHVTLTDEHATDAQRAWAAAAWRALEWVRDSPAEYVRDNMSAEEDDG